MTTVKFLNYNCVVELLKYSTNNRTAIELTDTEDGAPVCIATINVNEDLGSKEGEENVVIKNYAENQGVLEVLVEAKVISKPIGTTSQGFPICKLLISN